MSTSITEFVSRFVSEFKDSNLAISTSCPKMLLLIA